MTLIVPRVSKKTLYTHIRIVICKKTTRKTLHSKNDKILKSGKNDHFTKAIIRQNGPKSAKVTNT